MVYIIIKACPNQFLTVLSTHPTPLLPRHHSRPFHYPSMLKVRRTGTSGTNSLSTNRWQQKWRMSIPRDYSDEMGKGDYFTLPFWYFEVFWGFWVMAFRKEIVEFQFLPKSQSTLKFNVFGALRNLLEELQYQSRAFLLLFLQNVGWPRTSLELLEWKGMLKEVRKFNLFLVTYLFNNEWNYIKINISLSFHLFSTVYI